jgi:hypothetical protein
MSQSFQRIFSIPLVFKGNEGKTAFQFTTLKRAVLFKKALKFASPAIP